MDESRKIPTIMALSANLILSVFLGLAILNGSKPSADLHSSSAQSGSLSQTPASNSAQNKTARENEMSAEQKAVTESSSAASPASLLNAGENARTSRVNLHISASSRGEGIKNSARTVASTSTASSLPLTELPPPPPATPFDESLRASMPSCSAGPVHLPREQKLSSVKFTGVIGNKAVLSFRRPGTIGRKKYDTVCLAAGEEGLAPDDTVVSVQTVEADRVAFTLGGKKIVQTLPHIH